MRAGRKGAEKTVIGLVGALVIILIVMLVLGVTVVSGASKGQSISTSSLQRSACEHECALRGYTGTCPSLNCECDKKGTSAPCDIDFPALAQGQIGSSTAASTTTSTQPGQTTSASGYTLTSSPVLLVQDKDVTWTLTKNNAGVSQATICVWATFSGETQPRCYRFPGGNCKTDTSGKCTFTKLTGFKNPATIRAISNYDENDPAKGTVLLEKNYDIYQWTLSLTVSGTTDFSGITALVKDAQGSVVGPSKTCDNGFCGWGFTSTPPAQGTKYTAVISKTGFQPIDCQLNVSVESKCSLGAAVCSGGTLTLSPKSTGTIPGIGGVGTFPDGSYCYIYGSGTSEGKNTLKYSLSVPNCKSGTRIEIKTGTGDCTTGITKDVCDIDANGNCASNPYAGGNGKNTIFIDSSLSQADINVNACQGTSAVASAKLKIGPVGTCSGAAP